MPGEFCLLETMRVDAGGQIPLLERHLARLQRSAGSLSFACNLDRIREAIRAAAAQQPAPVVLRLLLNKAGEPECLFRPLPAANPRGLRLAAAPVASADVFLRNKTTARQVYEQAKAGIPEEFDALLFNERGEVTETTIANIAVLRDGRWLTPPVSCGLLAGVKREQLLEEGAIVEGVIRMQELVPGEIVRCFNAVRGVYDLPLV